MTIEKQISDYLFKVEGLPRPRALDTLLYLKSHGGLTISVLDGVLKELYKPIQKIKKEKPEYIYKAVSEDLSKLNGTEHDGNSDNWVKYFNSMKNAMDYCEKDYEKQVKGRVGSCQEFRWEKKNKTVAISNDLLFVYYFIERIKMEN